MTSRDGLIWIGHGDIVERLGYVPGFFDNNDPRSAKEQLNERYAHGGGWLPVKGFTFVKGASMNECRLVGSDNMLFRPYAAAILHPDGDVPETIIAFDHAMFVIEQVDGTWEAARLD